MLPRKNFEICVPQVAGNALKLSILTSLRYFVSFCFTIPSGRSFWLMGGGGVRTHPMHPLPTGIVLRVPSTEEPR